MYRLSFILVLVTSVNLSFFAASNAIAQSGAPAESDDGFLIDEIVVVANRRQENLQETSAVVKVLDEAEVEALRLDSLESISGIVPGLSLDGSHRDQNRLGLRGAFSSADTPSSGQAVGLIVDGVYFGRSADMAPILFDIERVEVLRGPQGTLYGPNVVGGLINITTRNPSLTEMEGRVFVTAGNYGFTEFGGRLSVPIVEDQFGLSLSVAKADSDGWVTNQVTGNKLNQIDTTAMRLKALWTPSDRVTAIAFIESWQDETFGEIRHLVPLDGPPDRFTIPSSIEQTLIADDGGYDRDVLTAGLNISFGLSDSVTLTSITAYHETDSLLIQGPFLAGPEEKISATRDSTVETFTQEFLISGETERLHWQAGLFYLDDASATPETFESGQVPGTPIVAFGYPDFFASTHFMDNDTESISGFGEATYALTDKWSITAGLRYTDESKDSFVETSGDAFPGNFAIEEIFTLQQSESWGETTPKLRVAYLTTDLSGFDSLLLYGSATRGFKSGDFVKQTTRDSSIGTTEPESVWSYEAGLKTVFADGSAAFNATLFFADYTELQSQVINATGFTDIVTNDAEAKGIDAEVSFSPVDGLFLSATYEYLDTEIKGNDPDVAGNRLPRSPENSYSLSGRYDWPVGDAELSITASYTYQDESYIDVDNVEPTEIHRLTAQSLLSAGFSVSINNFVLSLWGKNLLDDDIVLEANDLSGIWSYTEDEFFNQGKEAFWNVKYMPSRTYGATIRWEF